MPRDCAKRLCTPYATTFEFSNAKSNRMFRSSRQVASTGEKSCDRDIFVDFFPVETNAAEFDPLAFCNEWRAGRLATVQDFFSRMETAVRLRVVTYRIPDFITRYPSLLTKPMPMGPIAGWEIRCNWTGLPFAWTPLTLGEVAGLLQQPGQGAVDGGVLGVLLAGFGEDEDGHLDQAEGVGGVGHVHLGAGVPGVAAEDVFAVGQDLGVVAGALGVLELGPVAGSGQEGEPAAAEVVLEFGLLSAAQSLPVNQIGRIELAARHQQLNAVVVIACRNDLVGSLKPLDCNATLLRILFR